MSRGSAAIVILIGVFVALGWIAFSRPDIFPLGRRHGLPAIEAQITSPNPHTLAFVYWSDVRGVNLKDATEYRKGSRSIGRVAPDCDIDGNVCRSESSRMWEGLDTSPRLQGLAIIGANPANHGLLATLSWAGPAYPKTLSIQCNFAEADLEHRCRVVSWTM